MTTLAHPDHAQITARHILIVDDEEGMRHMLSLALARHGYVVDEAADGQAALARLTAGDIDIVLADVRMPVLDGPGLLREIRAKRLPVMVIMMSAFVDLDTAITSLALGAADYVSKPFRHDEVLLKIRMAEERRRLAEERERLQAENTVLRRAQQQQDAAQIGAFGMVGKSSRMRLLYQTLHKIADHKTTVLLLGESGTGKELMARAIHHASRRSAAPFVAINCGAIPETLLESELFGHMKGAFTDATRNKPGLIEESHGGTLFLDEVGELPYGLQVKLLRFLQEDEIRRVGDTKDIPVDVRIIAATSRDLQAMVDAETFRQDLYYRLHVLPLTVPPLRERRDDIPLLVDHFLQYFGQRLSRPGMVISREALRALMDYSWPGNIRELENTIERTMVLSDTNHIGIELLPEYITHPQHSAQFSFIGDDLSIKRATRAIEKELIRRSLERTQGNRTRASVLLDISPRALIYKIKDYGLG